MPNIDDAIPGQHANGPRREVITIGKGRHPGIFLGVGAKWQKSAYWAGPDSGKPKPKCYLCKGAGTGPYGEPNMCSNCKGSGEKIDTRTHILLDVYGEIIKEEVNYTITESKKIAGQPPIPESKFFAYLKELSGLEPAPGQIIRPEDVKQWYKGLEEPVRVLCWVKIGDHPTTAGVQVVQSIERRDPSEPVVTRQVNGDRNNYDGHPSTLAQQRNDYVTGSSNGDGSSELTNRQPTAARSPQSVTRATAAPPPAAQFRQAVASPKLFNGKHPVMANSKNQPLLFIDGREVCEFEDEYRAAGPEEDGYKAEFEWVTHDVQGKPFAKARLLLLPSVSAPALASDVNGMDDPPF